MTIMLPSSARRMSARRMSLGRNQKKRQPNLYKGKHKREVTTEIMDCLSMWGGIREVLTILTKELKENLCILG